MLTPEQLAAKFAAIKAAIMADDYDDFEAGLATDFIVKYRVQLAEVIPTFDLDCHEMSEHEMLKADAVLARMRTDGCGKCRGCILVREARERVLNPEARFTDGN
jgi:hypothetical protein